MPQAAHPIRILAMVACPQDGPAFDAEREWEAMKAGLESLASAKRVDLVRLEDATEVAFNRRLTEQPWHVVHFVGRGRSQGARYATLVFEGQARRARAVTARHFGELLRKHDSPRLAVLQACCGERDPFREAAALLVDEGFPAVVTAAPSSQDGAAEFVRLFYSALVAGKSLPDAVARAAGADVTLYGGEASASILPRPSASLPEAPIQPGPLVDPEQGASAARVAEAIERREELERRRAAGKFDVFLCHNSADKPAVKRIGRQLTEHGVLPWLDEWELRPGMPWQRLLEEQIADINAAAVFVGPEGIGPWQRQELDSFLRQFVARSCPVIPVLLSDAPREPRLPLFLQGMTWVDFRESAPDPIERLIWGITGRRAPLG